ncbi:MAG: response regulator [Armatimonadetes bacterium]|nr:response regulator [Anaerolineae bacterium]
MSETQPSILYVEDDPTSRLVMQMILDFAIRLPYHIFEDSTNFLDRLLALPQKPSVFLLDIHMLPMDGFGMLSILRSHPDYRDAIVVAVTASVMNEEVVQLQRAGFNGGIAKPIDQKLFPDLLQRILAGEKIWHIV